MATPPCFFSHPHSLSEFNRLKKVQGKKQVVREEADNRRRKLEEEAKANPGVGEVIHSEDVKGKNILAGYEKDEDIIF